MAELGGIIVSLMFCKQGSVEMTGRDGNEGEGGRFEAILPMCMLRLAKLVSAVPGLYTCADCRGVVQVLVWCTMIGLVRPRSCVRADRVCGVHGGHGAGTLVHSLIVHHECTNHKRVDILARG